MNNSTFFNTQTYQSTPLNANLSRGTAFFKETVYQEHDSHTFSSCKRFSSLSPTVFAVATQLTPWTQQMAAKQQDTSSNDATCYLSDIRLQNCYQQARPKGLFHEQVSTMHNGDTAYQNDIEANDQYDTLIAIDNYRLTVRLLFEWAYYSQADPMFHMLGTTTFCFWTESDARFHSSRD